MPGNGRLARSSKAGGPACSASASGWVEHWARFAAPARERWRGRSESSPVQRPGVPVWVAGFYGKPRPLRRAARNEGFFPVNLEHPDQLAEIVADLTALRSEASREGGEPYDVVAALPPGTDPAPYAMVGATWWMVEFPWDAVSVDQVRGTIRDGPAEPR